MAAVAHSGDRAGFAALDLSTGEFRATEFQGDDALRRIQEELQQLRPKEVLYGSAAPLFAKEERQTSFAGGCAETPLDDWVFSPDHAIPILENHFGVLSLEGFGLAGKPAAASAAGAIIYYVRSTQRGTLNHVDRLGFYERQNCLILDTVTVRNLELIEPLFAGADAGLTLLRSIDQTITPMGKRSVARLDVAPLHRLARDQRPIGCGGVPSKKHVAREELRRSLDGILDLERLLSRVTLEAANPRDVLALASSLEKLPYRSRIFENFLRREAEFAA